jgi:hypothetical protein
VSVRVRPSAPVNYGNCIKDAELCSGSTEDFGSSSPGSNPGSAATAFPGSSMVEWAAVNRLVVGSSPTRGAKLINTQDFSIKINYLQTRLRVVGFYQQHGLE